MADVLAFKVVPILLVHAVYTKYLPIFGIPSFFSSDKKWPKYRCLICWFLWYAQNFWLSCFSDDILQIQSKFQWNRTIFGINIKLPPLPKSMPVLSRRVFASENFLGLIVFWCYFTASVQISLWNFVWNDICSRLTFHFKMTLYYWCAQFDEASCKKALVFMWNDIWL